MKDDKAKHTTSRLSANGLLEINRQRLKKALQLRSHRPCPTCGGAGTIASSELVGLNVLRRIETRAVTGRLKAVRVSLHPELADAIQNDLRRELADLEREFEIRVEIIAATGLHRSEEKIEWTEKSKAPSVSPVPTAAVTAADLADGIHSSPPKSEKPPKEADGAGETPDKTEKPARKRRRGGRKRKKTSGSSEESPAVETAAESTQHPEDKPESGPSAETDTAEEHGADGGDKPARKRRRGGRKRKKKAPQTEKAAGTENGATGSGTEGNGKKSEDEAADKPKKPRRRRPRRSKKPKADAKSKPEPKEESKPKAESKPDKGPDPFAY